MLRSESDLVGIIPDSFKIRDYSNGVRKFPLPFRTLEQTRDEDRILYRSSFSGNMNLRPEYSFEVAGQREALYYDPKETVVGIATCGGIAAGLNDVIRAVSYTCFKYGVKKIYG
jgi:6-phosphofructokinase 1